MPRGDKSSYIEKQKRQAAHIEERYEKRGVGEKIAQEIAWATVNKESGGIWFLPCQIQVIAMPVQINESWLDKPLHTFCMHGHKLDSAHENAARIHWHNLGKSRSTDDRSAWTSRCCEPWMTRQDGRLLHSQRQA